MYTLVYIYMYTYPNHTFPAQSEKAFCLLSANRLRMAGILGDPP